MPAAVVVTELGAHREIPYVHGTRPDRGNGRHRAAAVYTLIETCKINDVDPQAWLADVLARLPDYPANKVVDLLPWNWKPNLKPKAAVAA